MSTVYQMIRNYPLNPPQIWPLVNQALFSPFLAKFSIQENFPPSRLAAQESYDFWKNMKRRLEVTIMPTPEGGSLVTIQVRPLTWAGVTSIVGGGKEAGEAGLAYLINLDNLVTQALTPRR